MILENGALGETYCIGGDAEMKNKDVVRSILSVFGKDESMIEYVRDRPGHDRRYAIDFSKIRDTLGWTPSIPFMEGIEKTVGWYRGHEGWWKRCISGAYREYYRTQYGAR
jgi:dTDP-glucose 4,6-dehydratase